MRRLALACAIVFAVVSAAPAVAHADTIYVSALTGSDITGTGVAGAEYATIQRGIGAAQPGDTIAIAPGQYNENVTMRNQVSLHGAGAGLTNITPAPGYSAIVAQGIDAMTTVSGISVTGASGGSGVGWYSNTGGGMAIRSSQLRVENCSFSNNRAEQGAGIAVGGAGSNPTISNCTFASNSAEYGGAMLIADGSAIVRDCTFEHNTADYGVGALRVLGDATFTASFSGCTFDSNSAPNFAGAIEVSGPKTTFTECTVTNNSTGQYQGGGIRVTNSTNVVISRSVIATNSAGYTGGGLDVFNGTVTVTDSTIRGNSSGGKGGGVSVVGGATVTLQDCNVEHNRSNWGGGIDEDEGTLIVEGGSVRSNNAVGYGGAIHANKGAVSVGECTFTGNVAGLGSAIFARDGASVVGRNSVLAKNVASMATIYLYEAPLDLKNCTIADNTSDSGGMAGVYSQTTAQIGANCILWGNAVSDLQGASIKNSDVQRNGLGWDNISVDPLFADSANGDYRLLAGSPCIDSADTSAGPDFDIADISRPQGAASDMGAYESYDAAHITGPTDPALSSPTHTAGAMSNKKTVTINMDDVVPGTARIVGYSYSVTPISDLAVAPHTVMLPASTRSFQAAIPTDGAWNINVATVDAFGNWSSGTTFGPLDIDTVLPTVAVTAPTGWQRGSATVVASFDDDRWLSDFGIGDSTSWWFAAPSEPGDSPTTFRVVASGPGVNTATFYARDYAGNYAEKSVTVLVDMDGPDTAANVTPVPQASGWTTGSVDVDIWANDDQSGLSKVFYRVGAGPAVEGSSVTISAPGVTQVAYWAVDAVGNASPEKTVDVKIDSASPTVSNNAPIGWVDHDVDVTFDGTDAVGEIGGFEWFSPETADSGASSANPLVLTASAEGTTTFNVTATDLAGNRSETSTAQVLIDKTTPETTVTASSWDWATLSGQVSLESSDALSGVQMTWYQVGADRPMFYDGTPIVIDQPAPVTVMYGSFDYAGNFETPHILTLGADVTAPNVVNDAPTGWQNHDVAVSFEATDSESGFAGFEWWSPELFNGGVSTTNPLALTASAEGTTTFQVTAEDALGNISAPSIAEVRIDKTAPVSTAAPSATSWTSEPVTVTIDAQDSLSGVVETWYKLGTGDAQRYVDPFAVTADGETDVTFWSVDAAGNSESPQNLTVRHDVTPPRMAHNAPTEWRRGPVAFDVTSDDAQSGLSGIEYYAASDTRTSSGRSEVSPMTFGLSEEGTTTVAFSAIDNVGNRCATTTVDILIDNTAPESSASASATPGSTWFSFETTDTLSGIEEIHWQLDGGPEQTDSTVYSDVVGPHTLTYWAVDNAGNAEAPKNYDFTVAPGGPDAPTKVRYTLRGSKTQLTWIGAARATGYGVRVNGKLVKTMTGTQTSALLPMVLGPNDKVTVTATGVSALSSSAIRGGYVTGSWSRVGTIGFKAGSSSLSTSAKRRLRTLAARVAASGFDHVRIDGFTAARFRGSIDERRKLSADRAAAVKRYLRAELRRLHSSASVATVSHGSAHPVAPNNSERNAAKNRRAEISVR